MVQGRVIGFISTARSVVPGTNGGRHQERELPDDADAIDDHHRCCCCRCDVHAREQRDVMAAVNRYVATRLGRRVVLRAMMIGGGSGPLVLRAAWLSGFKHKPSTTAAKVK